MGNQHFVLDIFTTSLALVVSNISSSDPSILQRKEEASNCFRCAKANLNERVNNSQSESALLYTDVVRSAVIFICLANGKRRSEVTLIVALVFFQ